MESESRISKKSAEQDLWQGSKLFSCLIKNARTYQKIGVHGYVYKRMSSADVASITACTSELIYCT